MKLILENWRKYVLAEGESSYDVEVDSANQILSIYMDPKEEIIQNAGLLFTADEKETEELKATLERMHNDPPPIWEFDLRFDPGENGAIIAQLQELVDNNSDPTVFIAGNLEELGIEEEEFFQYQTQHEEWLREFKEWVYDLADFIEKWRLEQAAKKKATIKDEIRKRLRRFSKSKTDDYNKGRRDRWNSLEFDSMYADFYRQGIVTSLIEPGSVTEEKLRRFHAYEDGYNEVLWLQDNDVPDPRTDYNDYFLKAKELGATHQALSDPWK